MNAPYETKRIFNHDGVNHDIVDVFQLMPDNHDVSQFPDWLKEAWNRDLGTMNSICIVDGKLTVLGPRGTIRMDDTQWIVRRSSGDLYVHLRAGKDEGFYPLTADDEVTTSSVLSTKHRNPETATTQIDDFNSLPVKYRRRSGNVDAFRLTKETRDSNETWPNWMHEAWNEPRDTPNCLTCLEVDGGAGPLFIGKEGGQYVKVNFGDWIVREDSGRLNGVTDEVFQYHYEVILQVPPKTELEEAMSSRAMDAWRYTLAESKDSTNWPGWLKEAASKPATEVGAVYNIHRNGQTTIELRQSENECVSLNIGDFIVRDFKCKLMAVTWEELKARCNLKKELPNE